MSRMPGDRAQDALLRALAPVIGPYALVAARSTPWSSATFEGARHRLALRLEGADAVARIAHLCATLAETDLVMRGAFVADIVLSARHGNGAAVLGIEALTIEEVGEEAGASAVFSRGARRAG